MRNRQGPFRQRSMSRPLTRALCQVIVIGVGLGWGLADWSLAATTGSSHKVTATSELDSDLARILSADSLQYIADLRRMPPPEMSVVVDMGSSQGHSLKATQGDAASSDVERLSGLATDLFRRVPWNKWKGIPFAVNSPDGIHEAAATIVKLRGTEAVFLYHNNGPQVELVVDGFRLPAKKAHQVLDVGTRVLRDGFAAQRQAMRDWVGALMTTGSDGPKLQFERGGVDRGIPYTVAHLGVDAVGNTLTARIWAKQGSVRGWLGQVQTVVHRVCPVIPEPTVRRPDTVEILGLAPAHNGMLTGEHLRSLRVFGGLRQLRYKLKNER